MTEILKTQNKRFGFWGTSSNHISEVSLGKRPDPAKRSLGLPSLCACRCGNLWS